LNKASFIKCLLDEQFKYASLQYTLPPSISSRINALRGKIPEEDFDPEEDIDDPHITIFYGLSDRDMSSVMDGVKDFGPLKYRIKGTPTFFDNPKHDVIVLPVESGCFHRLHTHIGNLTGKEPPTFKEYKPQVTIAYLKKSSNRNGINLSSDINGLADVVDFYGTNDKPHIISLT
jgi:2'-5' RNA ligase